MKDLRLVWFQDLEEVGNVYEIEMKKRKVGRNHGLPDGQSANIAVLLRLFGPISRQARFRADAYGHRQPLFRPFNQKAGRGRAPGNAGGVSRKKKEWFAWDK